jgi:hypothetical protein
MKRYGFFITSLIVLILLASCYWMGDFDTGGINLKFSGAQSRVNGDVVRVYLIANGLLFSTESGVAFTAEVPLATNEETVIEIDGLPVGPRYQALIGVGPVTGGIFRPRAYGETEEFRITAGEGTSVTPSMDYIEPFNGIYFSTDLQGKNLVGVIESGSEIYAAEEDRMYMANLIWDSGLGDYVVNVFDSYDLAADPDSLGVDSHIVNGLSQGNFWGALMNSNKGIVPFTGGDGWDFDTAFSSAMVGDRNVEESDILTVSTDLALFFRRSDGIGGVYITGGISPQTWVNLDVNGTRDMVVSSNNSYFATEGGAFALAWEFLLDSPPKLSERRMAFSGPAEILSLEYLPIGVAADRLFMGTTDGVWEAEVTSESPVTLGILTQIPETAGQPIEMIDISEYWANSNQAFLSRYYLYIRYGATVYRFPFFALFPGKVTGMTWSSDSKLYISGTEGLSVLYVGS